MLRPTGPPKKACLKGKRALSGKFAQAGSWPRFYPAGPSVASARNACGKLSTGMMRSPSAYLRASLRVVPSRHEENIHTRIARADRLLLDSADRADRAVGEDLAGRRDLVAVVDVASELLHHVEREREPGGRAADRCPASILTGNGSWMSGAVSTEDADDRAARLGVRRRRSSPARRASCGRASTVKRGDRTDLQPCHRGEDVAACWSPRLPSTATARRPARASRLRACPARRRRSARRSARSTTFLPAALRATAAAISCDRRMSCRSICRRWLSLDARRVDGARRVQVGALVQAAEEALEQRRLAHDDVDEVDATSRRAACCRRTRRAVRPDVPCPARRCSRSTGRRAARGRLRAARARRRRAARAGRGDASKQRPRRCRRRPGPWCR